MGGEGCLIRGGGDRGVGLGCVCAAGGNGCGGAMVMEQIKKEGM